MTLALSPSRATTSPSGLSLADLAIILVMSAALVIGLMIAPDFGPVAYALPTVVIIGIAVLAILVYVPRPALIVLTFFAICVLSLSFRDRAVGDTGLDWQNGLKFLTWTLMLCVGLRQAATARLLLRDRAVQLIVLFCCYCAASSLWSAVPTYSLACAIGCFAWFGLAIACVARLDGALLMRILTWSLFIECVIGLAVALLLPDAAAWLPEAGSDSLRLAGLSGHPNLLGQHSALLLIVAAARHQKAKLGRLPALGTALVAAGVLALTGSRTAIFAVVIAFLAAYYRAHPRAAIWSVLSMIMLSAIVLLLSGSGLLPDIDSVLKTISRSGDTAEITTATNRAQLWEIAWGHFLERPLLGWGFNGTEQLMADSVAADFEGNAVNAHNLLLQSLMSLGLLGSTIFFGFFAIAIARFFTRPEPFRDRLIVFLMVLGTGEAELLSIPVLILFLLFWCLTRDAAECVVASTPAAVQPAPLPPSPKVRRADPVDAVSRLREDSMLATTPFSILLWHWGSAGAGAKFTLDLADALRRANLTHCFICATSESELASRSRSDSHFAVVPEPPRRLRESLTVLAIKAWNTLRLSRALARALDDADADVAICTMQTVWDLFALTALKRRHETRYILFLHDAWFRRGDTYPLRAWALRRQIAAADGLVVLSDYVGDVAWRTFAYPRQRMRTIPHAAFMFGSDTFEPRRLPVARPVRLLFLGRIVAYKGLPLLIAAYRDLIARGVSVTLSIVGDGEIDYSEREILATLPAVTLINRWLSDADIQAALRDNDVVVLPYVEATQSGIAAAAFAAALPIVATPVGGLTQQVEHASTGLIAVAVTASALADAIECLVGSPSLYANLSSGALRHAREDLSWDATAVSLLRFVDEICRAPKRNARDEANASIRAVSTFDSKVQS